jgi:hypothetical protein
MRIAVRVIIVLACLATAGCAVHPVRGCINRPLICAGVATAGVAGGVFLWRSGALALPDLPSPLPFP